MVYIFVLCFVVTVIGKANSSVLSCNAKHIYLNMLSVLCKILIRHFTVVFSANSALISQDECLYFKCLAPT